MHRAGAGRGLCKGEPPLSHLPWRSLWGYLRSKSHPPPRRPARCSHSQRCTFKIWVAQAGPEQQKLSAAEKGRWGRAWQVEGAGGRAGWASQTSGKPFHAPSQIFPAGSSPLCRCPSSRKDVTKNRGARGREFYLGSEDGSEVRLWPRLPASLLSA